MKKHAFFPKIMKSEVFIGRFVLIPLKKWLTIVLLFCVMAFVACENPTAPSRNTDNDGGNPTSTGGNTSTGDSTTAGGNTNTGTGGNTSTGDSTTTGGNTNTGGNTSTGDNGSTQPGFVPVTGITGVPDTAIIGSTRTLTGIVAPGNATNNIIVWSIEDKAGNENVKIDGNKLSGHNLRWVTMRVRATVKNGTAQGTDYFQIFDITVNDPPSYGIELSDDSTALGNGGTLSLDNKNVGYSSGSSKDITVQNIGSNPTGVISVSITTSDFVTTSSIGSIGVADSNTITIQAKTGLLAGTHTAVVTLTYNGSQTYTFTVRFTVIQQYTVTFNTTGGNAIAPQTVNAGSQVYRPNPTRENYYFDNWYTAETGGSVVSWPLTVNGNITIYARWNNSITFNTMGGSPIYDEIVNAGSQVNRPSAPTRGNYTFDNWYTAETGGSVVTWPLTVNGHTTIYARWIIIRYTITFNTMGGSVIDTITADSGSQVTKPANPTRTDYIFDGWYYDETVYRTKVTWPLTVRDNITVYARWTKNFGKGSITISFTGNPKDEETNLIGETSTLSWLTGTLNLSVPTTNFSGANYQWYLDGQTLNGKTSSSLIIPGNAFALGLHRITLQIITADYKLYSKSLQFTVTVQ